MPGIFENFFQKSTAEDQFFFQKVRLNTPSMEFGSWIFSYPPPEKFPAVLSRTFTPPLRKFVSTRMARA